MNIQNIEETINFLKKLENAIALFRKKEPILTQYQNTHKIKDYKFLISLSRSKKYSDCLDLSLNNLQSIFKENEDEEAFPILYYENIEINNVLKTLVFAFINIYKIEEFKEALNALKNDEKSFYVEN